MSAITAVEIRPNAYYTTSEAAKLLKTTKRNIESLLKKGELHGIRLGKDWRLLGSNLLELGASNKSDRATFSALSTETFNCIWNNAEDAAYDNYCIKQ